MTGRGSSGGASAILDSRSPGPSLSPNIFIDPWLSCFMRFVAVAVIVVLVSSSLAFAQQVPNIPSVPESFNPSNVVYQIFSFLIFGSVNMRSEMRDYVDVWYTYRGTNQIMNDQFLTAYVQWYRTAKSGAIYTQSMDTSIVPKVKEATKGSNFFGRLLVFMDDAPDSSKARVLVSLILSFLLAFGISFIICLPLPPGIMALGESGIEAFLVALISTVLLTWLGVTSKFWSLLTIIGLAVLMAVVYSFLYAKHGLVGFYLKRKKGYEYPSNPFRGWD